MRAWIAILVCGVLLLQVESARANYAMDPQRKPDPAFTKFFLGRVDGWLRAHVFDYREKLPATDRAFVDEFLRNPRSLGEVKNSAFIRTYSFMIAVEGPKISFGPFRFVRPQPTPGDLKLLESVIVKHGLKMPNDAIGVGFFADSRQIELITETAYKVYRDGKLKSVTQIRRDVKVHPGCPLSPSSEQVDELIDDKGLAIFSYHSSQSEDEAFSMEGRRLVRKIQLGLQLSPGVIDFRSQLNYGLQYP